MTKVIKNRGLSSDFLAAMREKLECGRDSGYVGWDLHWKDCVWEEDPDNPTGFLAKRLEQEVQELILAVKSGDKKCIRLEAADVANFAMMIADIEGSLGNETEAESDCPHLRFIQGQPRCVQPLSMLCEKNRGPCDAIHGFSAGDATIRTRAAT